MSFLIIQYFNNKIIFVFFCKKFFLHELQNELNMMHSSDEDIELCSVDRFGSIEPNFLQKKHKNNQKIRVRFEI